MYFATSMSDLQLIVNSNCGDPHRILGMHEENIGGKDCVVVRVFNPEAKSVKVIDDKKGTTYDMEKIHEYGFFECVIKTRKRYFKYQLEFTWFNDEKWTSYDP